MKKTILFLDIDEVFSLADDQDGLARLEWWKRGLPAWPIPLAFPLLRAFAQDRRLHPVWMTSWATHALLWNERAGTRPFPVAYPLTRRQLSYAHRCIPDLPESGIGDKLLAVRYYLRPYPTERVVWIEDGFSQATEEWAAYETRVRLVDTTKEPLFSLLLADHANLPATLEAFLSTYIYA